MLHYYTIGVFPFQFLKLIRMGVRIAIPTGDGEKITVRLPAGVSAGKRFRIKDRNLLVIAVEG